MTARLSAIGALAILALNASPALAQDALPPFPTDAAPTAATNEERINLRVGDVFEIMADAGVDGSTSSWILTQGRVFIKAEREKLFQYRFVQDSDYVLRAEVTLPSGERRQRTFNIAVSPTEGGVAPIVYPAGTGADLAGTVPAPDTNRRLILAPDQQVVRLNPLRNDISPLALDLDAARDTDGDGNPGNDVDNAGTYFHSYGRPLWIWFARPLQETELIITAVPAGQSPLVQRISILSEQAASSQGVLTSTVTIAVERIDGATYSFSPSFARPIVGDEPLLYEWDFGDGTRSLETNPVHAYAAGGDRTVKLNVRDLGTGNAIGKNETTVTPEVATVDPTPDATDPTDPGTDVAQPEVPTERTDGSSVPWGRIILIGLLFLVSLAIGIAIVWLLSFLRRSRKLEETLETMEKAVVPAKETSPPPLAIKGKPREHATEEKQKVIDAELNGDSPATRAQTVDESSAPDWLKKGLASDAKQPGKAQPQSPKTQPAAPAPVRQQSAPTNAKPAPVPQPAPRPVTAPAAKPNATTPAPTPKPTQPVAPRPVTPPAPKQGAAPTPPAPRQQSAPPAQKQAPAPVTPPRPTPPAPVKPPVAQPMPAQSVAPQIPKPVTPAPQPQEATPQQPRPPVGSSEPIRTNTPASSDPEKLPRWLQPTTDATPAPTASSTPPAPTTAPTPRPQQPEPKPMTPAPIAPSQPTQAKPANPPTPAMPSPATPSSTEKTATDTSNDKDDDRPIAIIRADSIDPGPAK